MRDILIGVLLIANILVLALWLAPHLGSNDTGSQAALPQLLAALEEQNHGIQEDFYSRVATPEGNVAVVAFFSSISSTCESGSMVRMLAQKARQHPEVDILLLLPGHFSDQDVRNLKINWNLPFPVEKANDRLSRLWGVLSQTAAEDPLNRSAILMNAEGVQLVRGASALRSLLN